MLWRFLIGSRIAEQEWLPVFREALGSLAPPEIGWRHSANQGAFAG
jgi:hypothetical protein